MTSTQCSRLTRHSKALGAVLPFGWLYVAVLLRCFAVGNDNDLICCTQSWFDREVTGSPCHG